MGKNVYEDDEEEKGHEGRRLRKEKNSCWWFIIKYNRLARFNGLLKKRSKN